MNLESAERDQNKAIFDALKAQKSKIEAAFDGALDWLRLDDNKVSRIVAAQDCDGFNKDNWPEMIAWLVDHRARLEKAISEDLKTAARKLRTVAIKD